MMKKTVLLASVLALVLGLSACGGSDTQTTVKTTQTQGQQLLDLKEAYDKGVITQKEYENAKEDILDQH
jgi:ABC-type glycerol-3-phosphate transport system substrate-binding protein